ncbi:hypothetical protein PGT21_026234 [Puccinia graminis f. sp. tritici]|uniref:Uncharacterized protein n=1 Tax=Puccinia graminis f. sp. tritici TaxID=56615 RepID=A0A5B0M4F4_PUCGR|nr:hypothetical protein PGT21_026234 [Puccinia graminis f. sp. tritici]KAA1132624.1 hypothetical protein PGTUg99_016241 [Puccinia graminis f. sp. tritici]
MLKNRVRLLTHLILITTLGRENLWTIAVGGPSLEPVTIEGYQRKSICAAEKKGKEIFTEEIPSQTEPSLAASITGAPSTSSPGNESTAILSVEEKDGKQRDLGADQDTEVEKLKTCHGACMPKNTKEKSSSKAKKKKKQTALKQVDRRRQSLLPSENDALQAQERKQCQPDSNEPRKNVDQLVDRASQDDCGSQKLMEGLGCSDGSELAAQKIDLPKTSITREGKNTSTYISQAIEWIVEGERELELRMQETASQRIRMAFQPKEFPNPGEIFPGVIKGKWSDVVHTSQPVLLEIVQLIQSRERSTVGLCESEMPKPVINKLHNFMLKTLKAQLKISNAQNHLPLQELSNQQYKILKFLWNLNQDMFVLQIKKLQGVNPKLNKYELHRRIITFTNQIVQKTILENWVLIKQSLASTKKHGLSFLNKVEEYFKFKCEFPNPLIWSNVNSSKYYPEDKKYNNPRQTTENIYLSVMGTMENYRRFKTASDLIKASPKWNLPMETWKNLQKAERHNGVSILNVFHFIHYLGLGMKNDIHSWSTAKVGKHITILNIIISSPKWYREIPWYQSADRAWLKETFKQEYDEKLKCLCERAKYMKWEYELNSTSDQGQDFESNADNDEGMIKTLVQLLKHREEERLIVTEHGLDGAMMASLKLLKDQNTNTNGITDWDSVWNNFPSKFGITSEQKEFSKMWIDSKF